MNKQLTADEQRLADLLASVSYVDSPGADDSDTPWWNTADTIEDPDE